MACSSDASIDIDETLNTNGYTQTEELVIQISRATCELKGSFDNLHELDYAVVRKARYGEDIALAYGDRLMIWANIPLRNFAVILKSNDFIYDELIFIPLETFGMVDELLPGEGFLITEYAGAGTLPWSGITFVDSDGVQRYFSIVQDQSGISEPFSLVEFKNRG